MTTYIVLINWTDQGIKTVRDSVKRFEAAKEGLAGQGGRFVSFFLTIGEYDMVTVCEAPDDKAMAGFVLRLGMQGNVRTKTLKAFPEAEYREIIGSLG